MVNRWFVEGMSNGAIEKQINRLVMASKVKASRNKREGCYAGKCRGKHQRWLDDNVKKRYNLPNEYYAWVVWHYKTSKRK